MQTTGKLRLNRCQRSSFPLICGGFAMLALVMVGCSSHKASASGLHVDPSSVHPGELFTVLADQNVHLGDVYILQTKTFYGRYALAYSLTPSSDSGDPTYTSLNGEVMVSPVLRLDHSSDRLLMPPAAQPGDAKLCNADQSVCAPLTISAR